MIPGNGPRLVLLAMFEDRERQGRFRLTVRHVVPVGDAGGGGAVGTVRYGLSGEHCKKGKMFC